jgi:PST family polysaccharide transporter
MFNSINYFSRNADNLSIGKCLGTDILGFYDKACVMLISVQNLTHAITSVLQLILSRVNTPNYFTQQIYLKYYFVFIIKFN